MLLGADANGVNWDPVWSLSNQEQQLMSSPGSLISGQFVRDEFNLNAFTCLLTAPSTLGLVPAVQVSHSICRRGDQGLLVPAQWSDGLWSC